MRVKFESVLNLRNGPTINFHVIEIENRETNFKAAKEMQKQMKRFFSVNLTRYSAESSPQYLTTCPFFCLKISFSGLPAAAPMAR